MNPASLPIRLKIGDFFIFALVLILPIYLILIRPPGSTADLCLIYHDEQRIAKLSLNSPLMIFDTLQTTQGPMVLEFGRNHIRVRCAGCPNQRCVRQGFISHPGETILCIPSQVMILIPRKESHGWDGLAR